MRKYWAALVRFGFRLLYHQLAWTYDGVSWLVSLGEWKRWQAIALTFVQGDSVLELGHGPGHLLMKLQANSKRVIGIDFSQQMGRIAQRKLRKNHMPARLVRARSQSLPFKEAHFDSVLATFPTEYIVDPETLSEVNRALKADGRFIIVPEGHLTGEGTVHRLIDWLFRITGQRQGDFQVDDANVRNHPGMWEPFLALFASAGFSLRIEQVQLDRSVATVFVAEKMKR